ncbi:hypothetical protein TVAG_280920 [Trichomonas vaginalis G3]|uniref:Uncharacterized protein n=1 Tax=Trichomonas vaginalis (strain ATCC PRA-98 / G3) TaxID=412133 RepID=A2DRL2_TRIV3|nr:amelogenin-related protein family [Trichomonas vaginalis G3]EAY16975.1 hypothetical protein TVAG_280920 [Trichomonas vaginalis G3]KAI5508978.1 amelogenin-related protein family [Trichomonas vaginalis G3]|eukprot:XP_001329198.1 hypothetical protein [Trichomonas vaginalis G3]
MFTLAVEKILNGVFNFSIPQETHYEIYADSFIYPYDTEHFTFKDSNNNIFTEFPRKFTSGSELIITPTSPADYKYLQLLSACLLKNCSKIDYTFDGYMKTNEAPGYYQEPTCFVFFTTKNDFNIYNVIQVPNNNQLIEVDSNAFYPREATNYLFGGIITLYIGNPKPGAVVQVSVYDIHIYERGYFSYKFTDEISFRILPKSVFVAFKTEEFTFESTVAPIKPGVFYDFERPFEIKVKRAGESEIVGTVSLIHPYTQCSSLAVEILNEDTSTYFSSTKYDYDVKFGDKICYVFTSPASRRYKFISTGQKRHLQLEMQYY